jgi:leucyl aminopeptidase
MISISFKCSNEVTKSNLVESYCYILESVDSIKNIDKPYFITEKDVLFFLEKKNFNNNKELVSYTVFQDENLRHCIFAGFSIKNDFEAGSLKESIRNTIGKIVKYVEKNKIDSIYISIPNFNLINKKELSELITSTILISSYQYNEYITDKNKIVFSNTKYIICDEQEIYKEEYLSGIESGTIIGKAVNQARLWGDKPPSALYPKMLADEAFNLLKKHESKVKIKIIEKKELESLSMGGIVGVGQGSIHDPVMLIAEYIPKNEFKKTYALVGKGVTFDTGGISIKPSENMEDMKNDMGGGAAVIAAFDALVSLNIESKLIVCVPIVENMPSGNAIKPGDILTFYNKKTAEIKNTDAEGRLILADALSYISEKYKPDYIIDLATLTGACCYAVGPLYAAFLTKNNELKNLVFNSGKTSGDRCWELPFEDDYEIAVESDVADVCNIGKSRYKAGTITAAFFLKKFVPENIPWVHIDMASVSMHPVGKNYLRPIGATGFGVRLLIEMLYKN